MNENFDIDFRAVSLLGAEQAHSLRIIPFKTENGTVDCLASENSSVSVNEAEFFLGKKVNLVFISPGEFEKHLAQLYPQGKQFPERAKAELKEESDVIRFVRKIMEESAMIGASDIHVERYETSARIRYRWEGRLLEKYEVPLAQYNAIVSRIKILAEMDIAERRLPQDGRINLDLNGNKIDIRVSTIPSKFGEKIVLRLLTRSASFLQLNNLGMKDIELERFTHSLSQPNGIILITGPTGSGKTTTLYAALSLLNKPGVNISTIEDPVEYNIEGINQVQVKEEIGLTFGTALRAFLRQDPDIIMVGEIRDKETAEIAIRAALTGHLVFSTIHTNSAWDSLARLMDMGIEPYLLAASLRLVAAQRLIRQLCNECKNESDVLLYPKVQESHGILKHYLPVGCPACHYTGYSRRKAIYEVVPVSKALSDSIKRADHSGEAILKNENISSLKDHVLELILRGETSLEEGLVYLI